MCDDADLARLYQSQPESRSPMLAEWQSQSERGCAAVSEDTIYRVKTERRFFLQNCIQLSDSYGRCFAPMS